MKRLIPLMVFGVFLTTYIKAQTWTGVTSSDWNTASNWSPATVPNASSTVIMNNGNPPHWPVLSNDITLMNLNMAGQIDTRGYSITINNNPSICGVGSIFTNSNTGTPIVLNFNGSNVVSLGGGKYMDSVIFNVNGAEQFYEGWNGIDTFFNKVTFNFNGTGQCMVARNSQCVYKSDVTVNRNGVAETDIFPYYGVPVGGNFAYSNLVGGVSNIGYTGGATTPSVIAGQLDVNIINPINAGNPQVFIDNIKNLSTGGTINIKYPGFTVISNDSLNLASLNISGVSSSNNPSWVVNAGTINGNLNVADSTNNANIMQTGLLTVNGNSVFTVNSNQNFFQGLYGADKFNGSVTYNITNAGTVYLGYNGLSQYGGNLTLNGINFIAPTNHQWPLTFIGSGADTLSFTNAALTFPYLNMQMTKKGTVMLAQPTTVTYGFQFNGGNVLSSAANPLIFNGGGGLVGGGGSDTSHVIGLVEKTGGGGFTFPLGDSVKYFPVTISNPNIAADVYTASFIPHDPKTDGYDTASRAATLQRVTARGYWDIQHPTGSSSVSVTLGYHFSPGAITDQASLSVAHWNGTLWEDLGNGGTTGNDTVGTVATLANVSTFSPFTIATINKALNPLPVSLIRFDATKQGNQILLQWIVASEENFSHYEIQRSSDGVVFESILFVTSTNSVTRGAYFGFDTNPLNGINYYRLKMVDKDGKTSYSEVIALHFGSIAISVYPNPAIDQITLNGAGSYKSLLVLDMRGKTLFQKNILQNNEEININSLAPGVYIMRLTSKLGTNTTLSFIKR